MPTGMSYSQDKRLRKQGNYTLSDECQARIEELSLKEGCKKSRIVEQAVMAYDPDIAAVTRAIELELPS